MSPGSTAARSCISAAPRSRLAPCAWSASSRSCASRSRLAVVSGSAGALPARAACFSSRGLGGLGLELVVGALDRRLDQLAVQRAVDDDRPAALELDQHAGGARPVDVGLGEPDRRRAVGVAVELLVQLRGVRVELVGLLAQLELGDLVRAGRAQVGGEHVAVAGVRAGRRRAPSRARGSGARRPRRCRRRGRRSRRRAGRARPCRSRAADRPPTARSRRSPISCCARSGSSSTFTRAVTRVFGQPSACAAPSSLSPRSSIARTALASS